MGIRAAGSVAALTVWPVKSMAGGVDVGAVRADPGGLRGDREFAVLDRRPLRAGRALSARNQPGLLRWSASQVDGGAPDVVAPDGTTWRWADPGLPTALFADLGSPVGLSAAGSFPDLTSSVLVTMTATHSAVQERFGRALDPRRWRTNLSLDLDAPPFAENGWEGGTLTVGDVVLRLLHPCKRCTIPTWAPDGSARSADLLPWLIENTGSIFGINARVERAGNLRVGDQVVVR